MLYEFADLIDPTRLPKRRRYWHYYIVGFVDGVGCFSVSIKKQDDTKFGWVIDPVFHVTQSKERHIILELLKRTFKCGRIIPKPGQEDKVLQYIVDSRRSLSETIIPFFEKNKPVAKWQEFQFFKKIVNSLEKGEHKTFTGITKLLREAYEMSNDRKLPLEEILAQIQQRVDASETIRRAP